MGQIIRWGRCNFAWVSWMNFNNSILILRSDKMSSIFIDILNVLGWKIH